jgi:hypothetical protein
MAVIARDPSHAEPAGEGFFQRSGGLAAAAVGKLGARPLGAALDDLARRARLDAHGR